jgi:predicted secreted protein
MIKKLKNTIAVLGLLITSFIIKISTDNYNYYERGESDTFHLKTGESITVKIRQNGSTGYQNCWLNECHCKHIKLKKRDYKSSIHETLGYIGAGGTEHLTFTGTTIGTDTIQISIIPPSDTCSCNENLSNQSKILKPKSGYQFIINVKQ